MNISSHRLLFDIYYSWFFILLFRNILQLMYWIWYIHLVSIQQTKILLIPIQISYIHTDDHDKKYIFQVRMLSISTTHTYRLLCVVEWKSLHFNGKNIPRNIIHETIKYIRRKKNCSNLMFILIQCNSNLNRMRDNRNDLCQCYSVQKLFCIKQSRFMNYIWN